MTEIFVLPGNQERNDALKHVKQGEGTRCIGDVCIDIGHRRTELAANRSYNSIQCYTTAQRRPDKALSAIFNSMLDLPAPSSGIVLPDFACAHPAFYG
jgi:hypothetical protein